jgi:hypothetical protein
MRQTDTRNLSQPRGTATQPDDVDLILRLKWGKHTFFVYADPLAPWSKITDNLLDILRQTCPDGLYPSRAAREPTLAIPAEGEEVHVAYGLMKASTDPGLGWKNLRITGDEKPVDKNVKNNAVVGFVIQRPDEVVENPEFVVEFPTLDEDEEMME